MSVSRFGDLAELTEVAAVAGVPVEAVVAFCESHSLPGVTATSVVSQSIAERIVAGIAGQ